MKSRGIVALAGLALALAAAPLRAADLQVTEAWAREMLPGQKVGAVYLKIKSAAAARVLGGASPRAARVEIHEMRHEGDVMKMRKLDALDLPAGAEVAMAPGGTHLMLMDVAQPLKPGEQVEISLEVEQAGKRSRLEVRAPVVPLTDPRNAPARH